MRMWILVWLCLMVESSGSGLGHELGEDAEIVEEVEYLSCANGWMQQLVVMTVKVAVFVALGA